MNRKRQVGRDPALSPELRELFGRAILFAQGSDTPDIALSSVLWDATTERTGPLRFVSGYVAEDARRLGLTKVTRASAEKVYDAGFPVVLVGSKINTYHFFARSHLAFVMWPEEGHTFSSRYNNFDFYLEPELGKPTTFLFGLPPARRHGPR